ncbi:hypothetical protein B0H14DRAFT_2571514 [Mycena olivaceomarginata]|nr:hypothetical protein B0H14DRAFT_2571514 [Mycena olivaceomarginata]
MFGLGVVKTGDGGWVVEDRGAGTYMPVRRVMRPSHPPRARNNTVGDRRGQLTGLCSRGTLAKLVRVRELVLVAVVVVVVVVAMVVVAVVPVLITTTLPPVIGVPRRQRSRKGDRGLGHARSRAGGFVGGLPRFIDPPASSLQ